MAKIYQRTKLQEVVIRGYKSIIYDGPAALELDDVSILSGASNAGKSNTIGFFRMLNYMMSKSFGRHVETSGTLRALLYCGIKRTPVMSGEPKLADSSPMDVYGFSLVSTTPDGLIITEERITWHRKGEKKPYEIVLESSFKGSILAGCKDPVAKITLQMLSYYRTYQFHDSPTEGLLRQACPVETANYLQSHGNNLPPFLLFLRRNHKDACSRTVDYARDVIPQFQDPYPEPVGGVTSPRWIDSSVTGYRFNVHQFSDEPTRFTALAALLLQPAQAMPNVIILGEPELGLHPYATSQLVEMTKDVSIHAQVIITTQGKDLIDHFDIGDILVAGMNKETQATSVAHLDAKECHLWLQNYTVNRLWDRNIIGGRPV